MEKQNPTIKVSRELKAKLDSLGDKGVTYENIIWNLIKNKKEAKK